MQTVLSCSECFHRKQKCDRKTPCGNCVKRGIASVCDAGKRTRRARTRKGGDQDPVPHHLAILVEKTLKQQENANRLNKNQVELLNVLRSLLNSTTDKSTCSSGSSNELDTTLQSSNGVNTTLISSDEAESNGLVSNDFFQQNNLFPEGLEQSNVIFREVRQNFMSLLLSTIPERNIYHQVIHSLFVDELLAWYNGFISPSTLIDQYDKVAKQNQENNDIDDSLLGELMMIHVIMEFIRRRPDVKIEFPETFVELFSFMLVIPPNKGSISFIWSCLLSLKLLLTDQRLDDARELKYKAVNCAYAIKLNQDPGDDSHSANVQRMTWFMLMTMDAMTSPLFNRPPFIQTNSWNVKLGWKTKHGSRSSKFERAIEAQYELCIILQRQMSCSYNSNGLDYDRLCEIDMEIEQWMQKYLCLSNESSMFENIRHGCIVRINLHRKYLFQKDEKYDYSRKVYTNAVLLALGVLCLDFKGNILFQSLRDIGMLFSLDPHCYAANRILDMLRRNSSPSQFNVLKQEECNYIKELISRGQAKLTPHSQIDLNINSNTNDELNLPESNVEVINNGVRQADMISPTVCIDDMPVVDAQEWLNDFEFYTLGSAFDIF